MSDYVSAFDLDHTLISANASFHFGAYLFRKRAYSLTTLLSLFFSYARFKFFGMPTSNLHALSFDKLFKGRPSQQVTERAEAFADEYIDRLVYAPALSRLREAQRHQHHTAIFSNSPDFLVAAIARKLGVDRCWGSSYALTEDGRFAHIASILEGAEKAHLLNEWMTEMGLSPDKATVYTDSLRDLEFLQAAGTSVGVNPDRRLKALCRREGWEII